jgi:hypothetical protein
MCLTYCGSKGDVDITSHRKLHVINKYVGRHLGTTRHKQVLELEVVGVERQARRTRVGLTVGKATLHTLREDCNYLQFEEKLLNLHLDGLDIASINNSVKFIEGFVDNMAIVMDTRIRDYVHSKDHVTRRERLSFAFAGDKVIELHRTGDAIGMFIVTEEGEIKHVFLDYLLVAQHTGYALNTTEIYEEIDVHQEAWTNAARNPPAMNMSCL